MNSIEVAPFHCAVPLATGVPRLPASIYVLARPTDQPFKTHLEERALFDTGAEITIMSREWARDFNLIPFLEDPNIPMQSRHGEILGVLVQVDFALSEQEGTPLAWTGQAWISSEWPGPTIIGWQGALEQLRFHLDAGNCVAHFSRA